MRSAVTHFQFEVGVGPLGIPQRHSDRHTCLSRILPNFVRICRQSDEIRRVGTPGNYKDSRETVEAVRLALCPIARSRQFGSRFSRRADTHG